MSEENKRPLIYFAKSKVPADYNSVLRCCHLSDTHQNFPHLKGSFDIIIHTGDFFPDMPWVDNRTFSTQRKFQMDWLKENIGKMKDQVEDKLFLFVGGNHDFVDHDEMEQYLNSEGIKAKTLHERVVTHEGISFYGFPYVPGTSDKEFGIGEYFNYEKDEVEMKIAIDKMVDIINNEKIDVIAAHAPIRKIMDCKGVRGIPYMDEAFSNAVKINKMPTHYLHGHVHNDFGISVHKKSGMVVSNAATSQHIICIQK